MHLTDRAVCLLEICPEQTTAPAMGARHQQQPVYLASKCKSQCTQQQQEYKKHLAVLAYLDAY